MADREHELSSESVGTFECPICGFDKPHSHTDQDIKLRRDQVFYRLRKLAEELEQGPRHYPSIYDALARVYGTDFGQSGGEALRRELLTAVAEYERQSASMRRSGDDEQGNG